MIKQLLYVSEAPRRDSGYAVPIGLSSIHRHARKANDQLAVTGILSYRNGYYIQVLEGPLKNVNELFERISLDSRHTNVRLILEMSTNHLFFEKWPMKLLMAPYKDQNFIGFIEYTLKHYPFSQESLSLLEPFTKAHSRANKFDYKKNQIYLSKWPNFVTIDPSPQSIELCGLLSCRPYSYVDLVKLDIFNTTKELDNALNYLLCCDALKIMDIDHSTKVSSTDANLPHYFFTKMKVFLKGAIG